MMVYISVSDGKQVLTIDGDLDMLGRLLSTLLDGDKANDRLADVELSMTSNNQAREVPFCQS